MFTAIAITLVLSFQSSNAAVQCLDNDGNAVDWYWVYKLNEGVDYAYYDSTSDVSLLTPMTSQTLDAGSNSCIERTVSQIYSNKETINWALYNDENAINGVTNYTCGHSKGMIAFDKVSSTMTSTKPQSNEASDFSGFWMIHSAPKFPNISLDSYEFAHNAEEYGQNFLCVTIDSVDTMDTIAKQLRYITPWVYAYNNLNSDTDSLSNFNSLLKSEFLNGTSVANLTGAHVNDKDTKLVFNHLTRSGSEDIDIFEDVISEYYGLSFEWQTWQDSSSDEPIYCTPQYKYNEEDIEKLVFSNGWYVENKDDHSKFGIATDSGSYVVCTGDMNRATSQEPRGGGYACFEDESFYKVIKNTINEEDLCKNQKKEDRKDGNGKNNGRKHGRKKWFERLMKN